MAEGKVVQVIGPTVDVEFPSDELPKTLNAILIQDASKGIDLTVEAALSRRSGTRYSPPAPWAKRCGVTCRPLRTCSSACVCCTLRSRLALASSSRSELHACFAARPTRPTALPAPLLRSRRRVWRNGSGGCNVEC